MGHFVPDHHADGAVVHRIVGIRVVERRLQNSRREADFVGRRVVVGVHRLRRHAPLVPVDRFAVLVEVVLRGPDAGVTQVLVVALRRIDRQRRVVLPLVRVADLHGERGQFFLGPGLRGIRHPVEGGDVLRERRLQVLHQFHHPLLVLLGEVLRHVHLAHGLAQESVGYRHGTFPAGFLLLLARHRAAVELERCRLEVVAQRRGAAVDDLCREVVADLVERKGLEELVDTLHDALLLDDHAVGIGQTHPFEVDIPVDGVVGFGEFRARHRVVLRGDVALLDVREEDLGQRVLYFEGVGGGLCGCGLVIAGEGEDPHEVILVGLLDRGVFRIHVVVAVAHRDSRLTHVERVDVAVHQVGHHADAEERVGQRHVDFGQHFGELCPVDEPLDELQVGGQRRGALGVQTHRVEPHLVEVRDLLLDAPRSGFELGHLLEEGVDSFFVVFAQHVEGSVAREFGFQRVVLLPAARGILVEVGVRRYRQVEVREVDGRGFRLVVLTGCHTGHGCC